MMNIEHERIEKERRDITDKKNHDEQMRFKVTESLNLKERFFIVFSKKRSDE